MIDDWYERIEPGVREIVRLLRDNGINTECSCEHEKYIQCQYINDGFIREVDYLLFNAGFRNYSIDLNLIREDGHLRSSINIKFQELAIEDPDLSCIDLEKYKIKNSKKNMKNK